MVYIGEGTHQGTLPGYTTYHGTHPVHAVRGGYGSTAALRPCPGLRGPSRPGAGWWSRAEQALRLLEERPIQAGASAPARPVRGKCWIGSRSRGPGAPWAPGAWRVPGAGPRGPGGPLGQPGRPPPASGGSPEATDWEGVRGSPLPRNRRYTLRPTRSRLPDLDFRRDLVTFGQTWPKVTSGQGGSSARSRL